MGRATVVKGDSPMQRFRMAILASLLLARSSQAQTPADDIQLPRPTMVSQAPEPSTTVVGPEATAPMVMDVSPQVNPWTFWVRADFAVGFINGKALPALVTTSPLSTPAASAGVPGLSTTQTLIGGTSIPDVARSVGKLDFGLWIDQGHKYSVAAGFFVTENKGNSFSASSDGTTFLARPFFDATTNQTPNSFLIGNPTTNPPSSGSVNIQTESKTFWGSYVDLRETVLAESWGSLESLIGYRYLHYADSIVMTQIQVPTPTITALAVDSFLAKNDFNGLEFGFLTELVGGGKWSLEILTKMSVGNITREVTINGFTQVTGPGGATFPGGVYALSSNIGNHFTSDWVVSPEIGLNLGYQVTPNVRVRLGYSFLFLQDIARAADQIDFVINPNLIPPSLGGTPLRPGFTFNKSELWMQSINLGVEYRF